jgi:hypothetical protein
MSCTPFCSVLCHSDSDNDRVSVCECPALLDRRCRAANCPCPPSTTTIITTTTTVAQGCLSVT